MHVQSSVFFDTTRSDSDRNLTAAQIAHLIGNPRAEIFPEVMSRTVAELLGRLTTHTTAMARESATLGHDQYTEIYNRQTAALGVAMNLLNGPNNPYSSQGPALASMAAMLASVWAAHMPPALREALITGLTTTNGGVNSDR